MQNFENKPIIRRPWDRQQSRSHGTPGDKRPQLRGMGFDQGAQALSPGAAPPADPGQAPDAPAPDRQQTKAGEKPTTSPRQTVERHEQHDPRLGPEKKPIQIELDDQQADENKPHAVAAKIVDPDEPGRTNHLWYKWKQTDGPQWEASGSYRPQASITVPHVKGDTWVAGELTVTKRGYLNVHGLSTTQRFAMKVRDTEPEPQQRVEQSTPTDSTVPGSFPFGQFASLWMSYQQTQATRVTRRVVPSPPTVKAPQNTKLVSGDRASLQASVYDPDQPNSTAGLTIGWTQDAGLPVQELTGQGTDRVQFRAPEVNKRTVLKGKVAAVDKTGLKGEDAFQVTVEPKMAAGEKGTVWGDPHFIGGDGGKYDIMGRPGGVYQILTDNGVEMNAEFQKWNGTQITTVLRCGTTISHKGADGQTRTSKLEYTSGVAKVDGRDMPRNKKVKLADGGSALFLSSGWLVVDTREGYKLTFKGKGRGNRKYVDFDVQTGARGVADSAEAGGLLGQTFDADKKARHGRKGAGAQGEGAIEGTVWDYEVAGGVFGAPKPGKSIPKPTTEAGGRSLVRTTSLVPAQPAGNPGGWVDAEVTVNQGDDLLIAATGQASEIHGRTSRNPNGDAGYRHPRKGDFLCPSAPAFALVGKIGETGTPFMVGANHTSAAPADGPLFLAFNDLGGTFGDNTGEYVADVQVKKPVQARGAAIERTAQRTETVVDHTRQTSMAGGLVLGNQQGTLAMGWGNSQTTNYRTMQAGGGAAGALGGVMGNPAACQTQISYTNSYAAVFAQLQMLMGGVREATRPGMPTRPARPTRPGIGGPVAPWLVRPRPQAPVVRAPAEKRLMSEEKGELKADVRDPDGRGHQPRVVWSTHQGPALRNLRGQGGKTLEFKAPKVTKRTIVKGKVTATDVQGVTASKPFQVVVEPKVAAGEKGRIWGDPHFVGGDGGKFDIMGRNGGVYNLLQDAGLRVTSRFKTCRRSNITVMDRCGVTLVGKKATSRIEFAPDKVQLDGKNLPSNRSVDTADGGSALYLGDRLIVDTREGYKLTFFKRRSGSIRYCDMDVETGARGVASDGEAEGLIGQTFDADKKARHGRKGAGAQGEGAIEGVVTDYELSGGIFGKTKDGAARPGAARSARRLLRKTVLVQANPRKGADGFVETGLDVKPGDRILVKASGRASEYSPRRLNRTPDGDRGYRHPRKRDFMSGAAPAFALVGRVSGKNPFFVGRNYQGQATKEGRLELSFNDLRGTFGDNYGSYLADVQIVRDKA